MRRKRYVRTFRMARAVATAALEVHAVLHQRYSQRSTSRTFPNPVTCSRRFWPRKKRKRKRRAIRTGRPLRLQKHLQLPLLRQQSLQPPLLRQHQPLRRREKLFRNRARPRRLLRHLRPRQSHRVRPADPWLQRLRQVQLGLAPSSWSRRLRAQSWSSRRLQRQRKSRALLRSPQQRLLSPRRLLHQHRQFL